MIHIDHNDLITILVGQTEVVVEPRRPYDPLDIDFLDAFSKNLQQRGREFPDLAALAFWCRKGNIQNLKSNFKEESKRIGRGLVFHIAPSNVPVNFAYSLLFGIISGNSNIVRVSSSQFSQVEVICEILNDIFSIPEFQNIAKSTAIISYPANDEISSEFFLQCDARVIWGGDRTVNHLRALPVNPKAVDLAFADRFSLSVINTESIEKANGREMDELVAGFYNDTYLMDQNACSSPNLIVWVGDQPQKAQEKFWNHLLKLVEQKYSMQPIQNIDKYTQLCKNLMQGSEGQSVEMQSPYLFRVSVDNISEGIENLRGIFGLFYETSVADLKSSSIFGYFSDKKIQTVTYKGFDPEELRDLVIDHHLLGVDRIVPIGRALDIGLFWDGHDVVRSLSRLIHIQ